MLRRYDSGDEIWLSNCRKPRSDSFVEEEERKNESVLDNRFENPKFQKRGLIFLEHKKCKEV